MDTTTNKKCCPEIPDGKHCDYLDFVYRLQHHTNVEQANRQRPITVEVGIHVRVERCTGPLQRGNLIYSTTLLPGEKVRLYTQDRRSRFSFDAESQLSYRHEQTAEEQYYMDAFEKYMSDLNSRDHLSDSTTASGSSSASAGTSGFLESLFGGPSVSVSGSFDASSTRDFLRELNVHAESSHNRSVHITRESKATQIGEVESRQHAEGESESHFESSSRVFENKNQCHAVSYLFYQVDKKQTTKFTIKTVNLRVVDPVANSHVINRPVAKDSKLGIIPASVLATSPVASSVSKLSEDNRLSALNSVSLNNAALFSAVQPVAGRPLPEAARQQALKNVSDDLIAQGILAKSGKVSESLIKELSFEFTTSIPTAGVMVNGCLDECATCEDSRKIHIQLDLENQKLQNKLLEKQIELLEKSQEYRCCQAEEEVEEVE